MAATKEEYIPGVCNIGRAGVRMRNLMGWLGLIVTAATLVAMIAMHVEPRERLWLFFPAMVSALGFLQSAFHFCVHLGFIGAVAFGPGVGKTESVEQAEFRRLDRRKAMLIAGLSVLIGATVAGGAYLLPV